MGIIPHKKESDTGKRGAISTNFSQHSLEIIDRCQCRSSSFEKVADSDRDGFSFGSYLCKHCGLIVTSPRLTEESMSDFYNNDYLRQYYQIDKTFFVNRFFYLNYHPYQGSLIYNFLKDAFGEKKKLIVAEIGCGCGLNLYQFCRLAESDGIDVSTVGVDFCFRQVESAHKHFNISKTINGSVWDLAASGIKVDLVICSHVIEHIPNPVVFLNELKKILKIDGLVYAEIPGLLDLKQRRIYNYGRNYYHFPHVYCYCLQTLHNVFTRCGFSMIKGTEYVQALFRIDLHANIDSPKSAFYDINKYLLELDTPQYKHLSRAVAMEQSGDLVKGIEAATNALACNTEFSEAMYCLARLYLRDGKLNKAILFAKMALANGVRDRYDVMLILGEAFSLAGQYNHAHQAFNQCRHLEPWNMKGEIGKARLFQNTGQHTEALNVIEGIKERNVYELDAKYLEGLILLDMCRFEDALSVFNFLLSVQPEIECVRVQQGLALRRLGRNNEALMAFSAASRFQPDNPNILVQKAMIYQEMGQFNEALRMMDVLRLKHPDNASVLRAYGGTLATSGCYEEALNVFSDLIERYPDMVDLYLNMSDVLRFMGKFIESLQAVDCLENINSKAEGIWMTRGKIYRSMEKYDIAYECFMDEYKITDNSETLVLAEEMMKMYSL
jgi:tetratricopeptide (TPR) repeat protein